MSELIFEKSIPGRRCATFASPTAAEQSAPTGMPASMLADTPPELPEIDELGVVRHFTRLSQRNFSVDTQFYPLGSCTMKYNPRICEKTSSLEGFAALHPLLPQLPGGEKLAQGALELIHDTERMLSELTGMAAFTLQPLAGAHGELAGMLLIAAYHRARNQQRTKVLIPDSAHGTNPASAAIAGFDVVTVKSDAEGNVDIADYKAKLDDDVAAVMLTCPSTLGLFEPRVRELADLAHASGALMYYDGANLNALMGRARPGDLGFDVVHLNVHKTLSTPHGGGGPGAGPVGVAAELEPYLPVGVVTKGEDGTFGLDYDRPDSIGNVSPYFGNFGIIVRAYSYMLRLGGDGLRRATDFAVLNANYLRVMLQDVYDIPFSRICMHEVLLSASRQAKSGVRALDIAKALIDHDIHPPTIYFPLTVPEALLIEPTETESKSTLDTFVAAMRQIAERAAEEPEAFATMPETTTVSRVDEAAAARNTRLNYQAP